MTACFSRVVQWLAAVVLIVSSVGLSPGSDAGAWQWIDDYEHELTGLISLRDTQSGPGAECIYDLRDGSLKVRVSNPNYIKTPVWTMANGHPQKVKLTLTTSIGYEWLDTYAHKASSWTVSGTSGQRIEIGGTRVLSDVEWGLQDRGWSGVPVLNGTVATNLRVAVEVLFEAIDSDYRYDGSMMYDIYYMSWYRTTVIDAAGHKTSTLGDTCVPPVRGQVIVSADSAHAGDSISWRIAGFTPGARVRMFTYDAVTRQTLHTIGTFVVDGSGAAAGTYKFYPEDVNASLFIYARQLGKIYSKLDLTMMPDMRPDPRSGRRSESVTFRFSACRQNSIAEVQWKRGSAWVTIAKKKLTGTSGRLNLTAAVPTWAPIGVNQLQYRCVYSEFVLAWYAETYKVTGPSPSVADDPTSTSPPKESPTPVLTDSATSIPAITPTETATPTFTATLEPTASPTESQAPTHSPTSTPESTATSTPPPIDEATSTPTDPAVEVTSDASPVT